jgi:hypothetical protein
MVYLQYISYAGRNTANESSRFGYLFPLHLETIFFFFPCSDSPRGHIYLHFYLPIDRIGETRTKEASHGSPTDSLVETDTTLAQKRIHGRLALNFVHYLIIGRISLGKLRDEKEGKSKTIAVETIN